ncbi:iron-containing redox enzyme family protein [Spirillospora sp. NPDC048819]|uniref:iron-containing redox enzyme family protein n=1 Tax=Spirillospora sp. NPDC048819 TaxID=3155268 RepID=UPI0033C7191E
MSATDRSTASATVPSDHAAIVAEITSWLALAAEEVDRNFLENRGDITAAVGRMNEEALSGDRAAFHQQQLLLSRIYQMMTTIPGEPIAEGSVLLHEITRSLETATIASEDRCVAPGTLESAPVDGREYLSWLKNLVRGHRAYKHPYYTEFIRYDARPEDLRTYVIQESLVDARFDDLLAMMQIGTSGPSKMEIAKNFWDEMGNGNPEEVHTHLFNKIYEVFGIQDGDIEGAVTANDLLSGNLAVLITRYRQMYPEAVGFLGMTEWLAPSRFQNVVRAWERLGLPDAGITYHRLHITIDSKHAAGWFHNVVLPAASSEHMRRGIARGALWRANSSARYLDERLDGVRVTA